MALKAIQRGKASNGCTNLSWWKNFATLWICALFSPKSKQKWKSSENLPKEGKNLPLEFHNFWKIDFGEISASFYRTNKGSRLQIWALFSRSKKLFSKPSLDTGMDDKNRPWWLSDLPPPQTFFSDLFLTKHIWVLDTHFVVFGMLRFTPIVFMTKLWVSEGLFWVVVCFHLTSWNN